MSTRYLIPLVLTLLACPSPPEDGTAGGGAAGGQAAGGNVGGGGGGEAGGGGPGGGTLDQATNTMCNPGKMELAEGETGTSQADITADFATFTGTITCDTCTAPVTLLVSHPPSGADQTDAPPGKLTSLEVTAGEPYTLKIPKSGSEVVLEVLGGANGDWFGVKTGTPDSPLSDSEDRDGVDLNISACGGATSGGSSSATNPGAAGGAPAGGGPAGGEGAIGPAGPPPDGAEGGPPGPPPQDGAGATTGGDPPAPTTGG
jgi:collagen type IV alpha